MSKSDNVVVDFGSTKQAALFFDYVVPLDGIESVSGVGCVLSSIKPDIEHAMSIISKLLPPDFGTDDQIDDFASVAAIGLSAIQVATGFYACEEMDKQAEEYRCKLESPSGLKKYITGNAVTVSAIDDDNSESSDATPAHRAVVSIADILVPDAKALDWDLIIELRKDREAQKRLRRLRVFASKEYAGKPRSFIADDLSVRLDDYERTLKGWGIKTFIGSLSTCLTLETTLQTGFASVAAILSGLKPSEAFAASMLIPCGRCALELGSIRLARWESIRQFPLAYVSDINKLTK